MNFFEWCKRFLGGVSVPVTVLLLAGACLVLQDGEAGAKGKLDIVRHDMSITLHPGAHLLEAVDHMTILASSSGMFAFLIGENFEIESLLVNGEKTRFDEISQEQLVNYQKEFAADEDFGKGAKGVRLHINGEIKHILEIRYQGVVYDSLKVPEYSRGTLAEETTGIIGSEGVFLSPDTHWYPHLPDDYAYFSIKVRTPAGVESLTEGELIEKRVHGDWIETEWDVSYPSKGLYLVAGNYIVKEIESAGVKIMGYFFASEEDLMDDYLDASARYVTMYNKLIGPYPFSKFAVVENFFPTGYGMPSYTLLGRRVIRLPFIIQTSLGHEVAHNWWGNGVYVDYSGGNWCEGLTAYYADYRYKGMISDSAAADYRRTINIDYTTYVDDENDFPLSEFEERTTPASRAIGYGKSAMVFHMLKRMVGEEIFYRTLRHFYKEHQFKEASWTDIQRTFERVSGRDLAAYFDQWVRGKGAPVLTLDGVTVQVEDALYRIQAEVGQNPVHDIMVPFCIEGDDTVYVTEVPFNTCKDTFHFAVGFKPSSISVDPLHDVLRRLGPLEIPPTISAVLGDNNAIIALPSMVSEEKRKAFVDVAEQLGRTKEATVAPDTAVTAAQLARGAVVILGGPEENTVHGLLALPVGVAIGADYFSVAGVEYREAGHSAFITFRNQLNPAFSVCVITGNSAEGIQQSGYKIIHYGKYSYVTFLSGTRLQAGVFPVEASPLTVGLRQLIEGTASP
ncbi:MAG: M1 family aminopeptidase [Candidatus Latescibacterota bacterium]